MTTTIVAHFTLSVKNYIDYTKILKVSFAVLWYVFDKLLIACQWLCTLMSCDILEMGNVSTATTTPSWSRKPATTRGTPGRKDWAHHLISLNLKDHQHQNVEKPTLKTAESVWINYSTNSTAWKVYCVTFCRLVFYLWKLLRCLGVVISNEVFSST